MKEQEKPKTPDVRLGATLAILTTRFVGPALILVTAATREDDTRLLAMSIARLIHEGGKRAAYVSLVPSPLVFEDRAAGPHSVLRPSVAALSSPEAFDSAVEMWQQHHDFLFVDAPNLLATTLVPHIARRADGVLIAMCRGRAMCAEDREAANILKHLGASTIGVVTTSPKSSTRGGASTKSGARHLSTASGTDRYARRAGN